MIILFPKRKGVKIATTLIFEEIRKGASFHCLMGMLDFARAINAITEQEKTALLDYIAKRG